MERSVDRFGQRDHWNHIYQEARAGGGSIEPSAFARDVARRLAEPTSVLELGCGGGRDAAFFARNGHAVTAVDFSEAAIQRARARFAGQPGLAFAVANLAAPLPFAPASFDLVYAHLSLHYFPDALTRRLFGEIARVLRPGGRLCFRCKSPDDPLYGLGERIEPDMFVYQGHVRHFFSEAYARDCLGSLFQPERIESSPAQGSAFVSVVARRVEHEAHETTTKPTKGGRRDRGAAGDRIS